MKFLLAAVLLSPGVVLAEDKAADKKDDPRHEFQGTWTIVDRKKGGIKDQEPVTAPTVVFDGDKYRIKAGDKVVEEGTFAVDATRSPKQIEVAATAGMDKGKKWHGVYNVDGDTLKAVVGPTDKDRPTKYDSSTEGVRVFTLKRAKK